jgi:hypothetical protein
MLFILAISQGNTKNQHKGSQKNTIAPQKKEITH